MEFDQSQRDAIEHATRDGEPGLRLAVITGGAGTGKTTIIKEIALQKINTELAAFAGKAAARLREATGIEASTIHRLLKFQGDRFARGSLSGQIVIIDEASMVSADLMAEIIKREPNKLILVGDPAQLPPVGKGQPFHDIITLYPHTVKTLRTCYRNTEAVYQAAQRIRAGAMPEPHAKTAAEQFDVIPTGKPTETQQTLLRWIIESQGTEGAFDFEQDIILCPKNGDSDNDPCTVKGLNKEIREIVNPDAPKDEKISVGDRVINTKNQPDLDVWNGTTGTVHEINQDGDIWVKLDVPAIDKKESESRCETVYTDHVLFDSDTKSHLQLAYALTVHKSQGSQYRRVIFIALERDAFMMMDRSLIYTAVTRAKKHGIVIGQPSALRTGIGRVSEKNTVLQELARGGNAN